jgi:hypothetical protein
MSRGLTTPNANAASARHVRGITFLELQFVSGTLYLHTGVGTYTWGSRTWLGIGALGSMSPVEETDEIAPYRVSYMLSAINDTILAQSLLEEIYDCLVIRYEGFLDIDGKLVDTPHEFRRDMMDAMESSIGGEIDQITLHCESEHIRDTRAPGRMFSDEDQQAIFPGDTGFKFLPQLVDAQVHWGPGGDKATPGSVPSPRTHPDDWNPDYDYDIKS